MVRPTAWTARGGVYDDGAGELSLSVFLALASGTTEGFLEKKIPVVGRPRGAEVIREAGFIGLGAVSAMVCILRECWFLPNCEAPHSRGIRKISVLVSVLIQFDS